MMVIASGPSASALSAAFLRAFAQTIDIEAGFTDDPNDAGNWTGGAVGKGVLAGTKWGISAASYPTLNIRALTPDQARAIYRRDYWSLIAGDVLPPALAWLVFDAAVNNGVGTAKRWPQQAAGVAADGAIGPATLGAVATASSTPQRLTALCCEFQARRVDAMARQSGWTRYGLGWARRLCTTLINARSPA